jgi:hypothetical protein
LPTVLDGHVFDGAVGTVAGIVDQHVDSIAFARAHRRDEGRDALGVRQVEVVHVNACCLETAHGLEPARAGVHAVTLRREAQRSFLADTRGRARDDGDASCVTVHRLAHLCSPFVRGPTNVLITPEARNDEAISALDFDDPRMALGALRR